MTALSGTKAVSEREITITRMFDAPRELVFRMWTEREHMMKWWGPHRFTNPVCEIDAWPGGAILIHMCGPDATVYPMKGEFIEIAAPERIVFTTSVDANGIRLLEGHNVVSFTEHGGKTTLTLHAKAAVFAEIGIRMLEGMQAGWTQSLERLEVLAVETR